MKRKQQEWKVNAYDRCGHNSSLQSRAVELKMT